jgi:glycosyltransferase 2 family protein
MKIFLLKIKPYFRWFILGIILVYLIKIFQDNWNQIKVINFSLSDYSILLLAFLVTVLAHIFAGIIWFLILTKTFEEKLSFFWIIKIYLITNVAKYLPGNIWHFYGRINIIYQGGCDLGIASISVLLEPLLMAASALLITLISHGIGLISISQNSFLLTIEILILVITLISFHPRIINKVIHQVGKLKFKNKPQETEAKKTYIKSYPLIPLLGELLFLILRSLGFLLIVMSLNPIPLSQIPILISAFSFAWLLGLIIPGAPGGIGIFEATIITLLNDQFSGEIIIVSAIIFRFISILAEVIPAGFAYIPNFFQRNDHN